MKHCVHPKGTSLPSCSCDDRPYSIKQCHMPSSTSACTSRIAAVSIHSAAASSPRAPRTSPTAPRCAESASRLCNGASDASKASSVQITLHRDGSGLLGAPARDPPSRLPQPSPPSQRRGSPNATAHVTMTHSAAAARRAKYESKLPRPRHRVRSDTHADTACSVRASTRSIDPERTSGSKSAAGSLKKSAAVSHPLLPHGAASTPPNAGAATPSPPRRKDPQAAGPLAAGTLVLRAQSIRAMLRIEWEDDKCLEAAHDAIAAGLSFFTQLERGAARLGVTTGRLWGELSARRIANLSDAPGGMGSALEQGSAAGHRRSGSQSGESQSGGSQRGGSQSGTAEMSAKECVLPLSDELPVGGLMGDLMGGQPPPRVCRTPSTLRAMGQHLELKEIYGSAEDLVRVQGEAEALKQLLRLSLCDVMDLQLAHEVLVDSRGFFEALQERALAVNSTPHELWLKLIDESAA